MALDGSGASAGESASHLGHVCGKALGQGSAIELGVCRSLTDSFSEELADEMRHGEATFGGHGIETGRQVAGEAYREVSVLCRGLDRSGVDRSWSFRETVHC